MTTRQQLLRQFLRDMDRFELRFRGTIGRARNALIRQAATKYAENGSVPAWLHEAHRRRIQNDLEQHYRRVIPHFGDVAVRQIKSHKFETKADTFATLANTWIGREALRKATMIGATDRQDLIDAIQDGIDEGEGTSTIATRIRKVSALTPFRAATVARTETHAAATFGSIESIREAERQLDVKMLKVWLPTQDDRTRPEHAAMANAPAIPLGERFTVGSETMDRPGDTGASPENTINCRCALAYEEAE